MTSPLCNVKIGHSTYYAQTKDKKIIEMGCFHLCFIFFIGVLSVISACTLMTQKKPIVIVVLFFFLGIFFILHSSTFLIQYYQTIRRVKKQNKDCRLS